MRKITKPPKISDSELSQMKQLALKEYIDKSVSVEQIWWDACFYALLNQGFEVVDPKSNEEKPLDKDNSKI